MDDLDAIVPQVGCVQSRVDFVLFADEIKGGDLLIRFQRPFDALDDDRAPMVAAHDIHYDSHK